MFTGIIQSTGKVVKYDGAKLWIRMPWRHALVGESISVEGVCLTVSRKKDSLFCFDVGPETARVTTLGNLRAGAHANLERALRYRDRVGGHWVTGHVDGIGHIEKIQRAGKSRWFYIQIPKALTRYIVPKGSLAVDGISLTVVRMHKQQVQLMIVPHTLRSTTLGQKMQGDGVNIETDILAKYAATRLSLRAKRSNPGRQSKRRAFFSGRVFSTPFLLPGLLRRFAPRKDFSVF